MATFKFTSVPVLSRAGVIILLLGLSQAGMAQELTGTPADQPVVVAEQVNINNADAVTIARVLVGVGLSRAEEIVSYREIYGEFTSMEDLLLVKGIGEATVRNNMARIRFD